jgi:hypothetical protein
MDPNLTYPIVINPVINATLIPAASNTIKDWLPSIISVVVVLVGGAITYLITTQINEKNRRYELRKEVYLEVLSAIFNAKNAYHDLDEGEELEWQPEKMVDLLKKVDKAHDLLKLLEYKLEICANREVIGIYMDIMIKVPEIKSPLGIELKEYLKQTQEFYSDFENKLVPAMKKDLMDD